MSHNYLLPLKKMFIYFTQGKAPYPHIFSDFIQLGPLVSCCKSLFSRDFFYFTTHTHTLITITPPPLPSPSLPVSARLSPLQPCLPVRKVLQCWRLGYRPPGPPPRTRASRRRTPRLGLPLSRLQPWRPPLLPPGSPTSTSCMRSSGSKQQS